MRKILLSAAALAMVVSSSAAFAATAAKPAAKPAPAPLTDTGAITAVDKASVTLADAKVFKASKTVLGKWKVGDNVVVTYKVKGTDNDASKIAAAPKA
jgi:hypothetical protein